MTPESDRVLVANFRRGDLAAFETLLAKHEGKIFNLALRLTRCKEDAEDVLQEVALTLFTKLHYFEGRSAFSSWLYRVVANASFMKIRKRRTGVMLALDGMSKVAAERALEGHPALILDAERITLSLEVRSLLEKAISHLPKQYRLIFILRDVDGLSNRDVAAVLSMSVPAVKSRLHRARSILRERLGRYWLEYRENVVSEKLAA